MENGPWEEAHSALKVGLEPFEQGILGSMGSKPGLEQVSDQKARVESPGQKLLLPKSKINPGSHHSLETP